MSEVCGELREFRDEFSQGCGEMYEAGRQLYEAGGGMSEGGGVLGEGNDRVSPSCGNLGHASGFFWGRLRKLGPVCCERSRLRRVATRKGPNFPEIYGIYAQKLGVAGERESTDLRRLTQIFCGFASAPAPVLSVNLR
jgi:hypothetical protein